MSSARIGTRSCSEHRALVHALAHGVHRHARVRLAVGQDPEGREEPPIVREEPAVEVDRALGRHGQDLPAQDLRAREGDQEVDGAGAEALDERGRVDGRHALEGHAVPARRRGDRVAPRERPQAAGGRQHAMRRQVGELEAERPRPHQGQVAARVRRPEFARHDADADHVGAGREELVEEPREVERVRLREHVEAHAGSARRQASAAAISAAYASRTGTKRKSAQQLPRPRRHRVEVHVVGHMRDEAWAAGCAGAPDRTPRGGRRRPAAPPPRSSRFTRARVRR